MSQKDTVSSKRRGGARKAAEAAKASISVAAAPATQKTNADTTPAPEPAPAPMPEATPTPVAAPEPDALADFEDTQKRYGVAYAVMAEGLKGDGIDRVVKIVQYGLAAFAVFVVVAAIIAA